MITGLGEWTYGKDLDVKFRYVHFIGRQGEILSRDCIFEKSVRDICRER